MKSVKLLSLILLAAISFIFVACSNDDGGWYMRGAIDGGTLTVGGKAAKGLFNDDSPKANAPSGKIILIKNEEDDAFYLSELQIRLHGSNYSPCESTDLSIVSGTKTFGDGTYMNIQRRSDSTEYTATLKSSTGMPSDIQRYKWDLDITKDIKITFNYQNASGETSSFVLEIETSDVSK